MLRSIGKQGGESVQSVLKKKKKATVGRICRKERFKAWNERVGVMDDESGESMKRMREKYVKTIASLCDDLPTSRRRRVALPSRRRVMSVRRCFLLTPS